METFIATYAIVWLALVLYIVRLRTNQRRLEQLARTLESRVEKLASMGRDPFAGGPGSLK